MNNHVASCTPMLRWRGWRPPFLDHESWERASDLTLVLEREGDVILLPCSSSGFAAEESNATVHAALTTCQELVADGWSIVGRLSTTFVGQYAEDHFWKSTLRGLGMDDDRHPYGSDLFWERVL